MNTANPAWQPRLERARALWLASPLPGFLRWWADELRALLPVAWRRWLAPGAQWHALEPAAEGWLLRRVGASQALAPWDTDADAPTRLAELKRSLQAVDRADLRLVLLLPPAAVLRRTLRLPLAARGNLREVLGFEMDRQTPFHVAQVCYAARELPGATGAGQFQVELVVVPRTALEPLLERAAVQGLVIDAVDVAAGAGRLGVNLLPPERVPRHVDPRRRLNLVLVAACVLLLGLVLGQWLHNRRAALAQMQATVQAMHGEAQQVAALRQQLQDNAGAAGFLAQRKRQSVPKLSVLAEATARLPDGAWLERFSVDDSGQIGLQGQSQQATRLLDVLKDSPLIADPSFQGRIQPDPATGTERFYLVAHVRQAPAQPAAAGKQLPGGDRP
jgi:general secretion pathway protein L